MKNRQIHIDSLRPRTRGMIKPTDATALAYNIIGFLNS